MLTARILFLTGALGSGQEVAIPLDEARRAFAEIEAASAEDSGRLWGRELLGPVFFVEPRTRSLVANQPDEQSKLQEKDGLFVGTLPEELGVANTAVQWAGVRWTMVRWSLPENRYARRRLLLHECFHRIQPELGLATSDPPNAHLDTEEGRAWLRLEWRALAEALIRRTELRKRWIEDALLFRAYRRSLFPDAAAQESALERNEGLAEYTGVRLSGWPEWVLADRAAVKLEQEENASGFVRSFAYTSGPAYGLLLDEADEGWRAKLDERSDLGTMLAKALALRPPEDLAGEARRRAERYGGAAVFRAEKERALLRERAIARHRARFVDGPVLLLPLSSVNLTFDPNAVESLGELGSLYGTIRITDVWGILEVDSGGALLARTSAGAFSEARVPAPGEPAGPTVSGDGWTLTLSEGWKLAPGARAGDFTVQRGQ